MTRVVVLHAVLAIAVGLFPGGAWPRAGNPRLFAGPGSFERMGHRHGRLRGTCAFQGTPWIMTMHGPWPRKLVISGRQQCGMHLRQITLRHIVVFKKMTLLTDPQHGSVQLFPNGRVTYRVKDGYQGADAFNLEVCGLRDGQEGCSELDFSVQIE